MGEHDSAPDSGPVLLVGGLVDETVVTLALHADSLDPDEVTRMMGVAPTLAGRKGDRRGTRGPPKRTGSWIHQIRADGPIGPEELCGELLSKLPRDPDFWTKLAEVHRITLWIGVMLKNRNRGFELSPGLLREIASIGATVSFDIYAAFGEDEDPSSE